MTTALIMGYSNFDLGLFNEKDIRLKVIKKAIRRDLECLAEEGIKWLVFTGNLGFESWVLDVANEMKEEYDFNLATIFDFETHGENWNEANQLKLSQFKQVDLSNMPILNMNIWGNYETTNDFCWKTLI